jgi:hypothetical protein
MMTINAFSISVYFASQDSEIAWNNWFFSPFALMNLVLTTYPLASVANGYGKNLLACWLLFALALVPWLEIVFRLQGCIQRSQMILQTSMILSYSLIAAVSSSSKLMARLFLLLFSLLLCGSPVLYYLILQFANTDGISWLLYLSPGYVLISAKENCIYWHISIIVPIAIICIFVKRKYNVNQ